MRKASQFWVVAEEKTYRGREVAYSVLTRVLHGGAYSNLVITSTFEKEDLTADERRAAMSLVYGVLRNLALLDGIFRHKSTAGRLSGTPALHLVGRMAIYELLFHTKVPAYAAASEYMKMARAKCSVPEVKYLNAILRRVKPEDKKALLDTVPVKEARMALEFSHPDWFVHSVVQSYGAGETLKMLRANNSGMPSYYRVNTSKISVKELLDTFRTLRLDAEISPLQKTCIYFKAGQGYFPQREYEAGWITPQDLSAQLVAVEFAPQRGESILDMCCGRGTKAAHIAEITGGKSDITACDIHEHKLRLLEEDMRRLGFECVKPVAVDAAGSADLGIHDRVLLDAPCSGTGTFRRRPELKQRVTIENLRTLIALQRSLLDAAAARVKPGGRLLYSTCSVLPEENDDVVEYFLASHPDFSPDRGAAGKSKVPSSRTLFGRVFLPHQIQACAMAVTILMREK